ASVAGATALGRPPTTGRARTHARRRGGEALKRLQAAEWPASSTVTDVYGRGRRPAPTPLAAPEHVGLDAVDTRSLACAWSSVNGGAEDRRKRYGHSSVQQQPRGRGRPVS